jgi:transposase-like protein
MKDPFRYFNSSPEVIPIFAMTNVDYPLSLSNVEDLLSERGIDISHDGPVLVEPVWSGVRRRDPEDAYRAQARLSSVALASG